MLKGKMRKPNKMFIIRKYLIQYLFENKISPFDVRFILIKAYIGLAYRMYCTIYYREHGRNYGRR